MPEALLETKEKPLGFVDIVDLQRPTDPRNPRKFVWLAQSDLLLSMAVVIDHGSAVIAALKNAHSIGEGSNKVVVTVSDLLDPEHASEIARNCMIRWIKSHGYNKVAENNTQLLLGRKNDTAPIDLMFNRKAEPLSKRLEREGIPVHPYHALLWAGTGQFEYPYLRTNLD